MGIEALLGGSVMALLPFVIQQLVYTAQPTTENSITGFLNAVGLSIATIMNYVVPLAGGVLSVTIVFALLLAESIFAAALRRKWQQGSAPPSGCVDTQY